MPAPAETVLVLGGTAEANALVEALLRHRPGWRVILSLAGRTRAPKTPAGCEVRVGGFGGAEGLAAYLGEEAVTRLVDATHPFAAGMSRNAETAASIAEVARVALVRRPWEPQPGDRWTRVRCLAAARDALPAGARAFLALGSQHLAPFRHRDDIAFVVRMIEPPEPALAFPAELVLGRPSASAVEEAALFERLGVTHLVCRNAGGGGSYAKLAAARALALPVVMIDRPPQPAPPVAASVEAVLALFAIA